MRVPVGSIEIDGTILVRDHLDDVKIAKAIENGGSVLGAKANDLKEARAYTAELFDAYKHKLYRIDTIIAVAEEWARDVITNDVIEEADRRIIAVGNN